MVFIIPALFSLFLMASATSGGYQLKKSVAISTKKEILVDTTIINPYRTKGTIESVNYNYNLTQFNNGANINDVTLYLCTKNGSRCYPLI